MDIRKILTLIDAEIATLQHARALLTGAAPVAAKTRLHFPTKIPKVTVAKAKRTMSPETRAKIAAAQKKRWAAQQKIAK